MSYLGEYIKAERERQGLTLRDICDKTAIRVYILEVLEEGNFESLPSYVHAHGFLAQYCRALAIDFETVVKPMFDEECSKETFGGGHEAELEKMENLKPIKKSYFSGAIGGKRLSVAVGFIILAILIGVIIYFTSNYLANKETNAAEQLSFGTTPTQTLQPQPTSPSAPVPAITPEPAPEAGTEPTVPVLPEVEPVFSAAVATAAVASIETQNNTPTAIIPGANRATIRFTEECWVNYLSDDGSTGDFIALPGSERRISFNDYFRVHLGNAAAATVGFNGKFISNFGASGVAMRNLYFSVDDTGAFTFSRTQPVRAPSDSGAQN